MKSMTWAALIALIGALGGVHMIDRVMGDSRQATALISLSEIIQVAQIEPSFVRV